MKVHHSLQRRHVRESNLIEGITASPGEALYDGHLVAARAAAEGRIMHPNRLHRLLTRRVRGLSVFGGAYRTCGVAVGAQKMPRSREVPRLMEEWCALAAQYAASKKNLAESAWLLHVWLLCIHPYPDGNGRTARLVWNMLRVSRGLPWQIVEAEMKAQYYAEIRRIETGVFQKMHPDAY